MINLDIYDLPKHIKRPKSKKFTKYRRPYKSYQCADFNWSDIFIEIDTLKKSYCKTYLKDISDKYGIVYKTLKNKYYKHRNKNLNVQFDMDIENRGGSNKIFTENEEKVLYDLLLDDFINKNKPLTNAILKERALIEFNKKNVDYNFNISDGWCNMFKKRWNLSTQRVKSSKKATNIPTEKEINKFLNKYKRFKKSMV